MNRALNRLHVEGFRSLKNVDLELGPVTVLIGPNGSGKTNLMNALQMANAISRQSLQLFVGQSGGASTLLHFGPHQTPAMKLGLEFTFEKDRHAYEVRLGHAPGDTLIFLEERIGFRSATETNWTWQALGTGHRETGLHEAAADPHALVLLELLRGLAHFHFHDTSTVSPLRQNSRQVDDRFLRPDGSNIAAYLRTLKDSSGNRRAAWKLVDGLIRRVTPFVKELRPTLVDPDHPQTSAVRLDWVDEKGRVFASHHLSDGTLRALALFTALIRPLEDQPVFISIDEPDLSLHPAAIHIVAGMVKSVSSRCQVLLATHSHALIDEFAPEEVVVTERADHETTFRKLEPDKLAGWLEDYPLSELYDKNLLGGRP